MSDEEKASRTEHVRGIIEEMTGLEGHYETTIEDDEGRTTTGAHIDSDESGRIASEKWDDRYEED